MINQDKWVKSLPGKNNNTSNISNELNHDKWINTIPKKKHNKFISKIFSNDSFIYLRLIVCLCSKK